MFSDLLLCARYVSDASETRVTALGKDRVWNLVEAEQLPLERDP